MYSLNDSKIYTMYFYLTYPRHDLPPTPYRTNLLVWFCKLGQYFPYRSVFLSHVEILNRNIFRNTPLQTFAKKITYLQWCQEHMPEQYWEVVQPHHLVLFFSTPPQSSSPNTCAWSKVPWVWLLHSNPLISSCLLIIPTFRGELQNLLFCSTLVLNNYICLPPPQKAECRLSRFVWCEMLQTAFLPLSRRWGLIPLFQK